MITPASLLACALLHVYPLPKLLRGVSVQHVAADVEWLRAQALERCFPTEYRCQGWSKIESVGVVGEL